MKLTRSCLKQDRFTFNHRKVVNIYTAYDLKFSLNYDRGIILENYLFGAIKTTKY